MFVFYNIFTMYESHDDAKAGITTGRRIGLDEYFMQAGATIVGIAEARSRARRCMTDNYLILAGGSMKQQFGCEVWIAKCYPIQGDDGKSKSVNITHKNIVLLHASPRILLVECTVNDERIFVFTFHAPHEQWGLEVREKFFKQLTEVAKLATNARLVTLGDVNGQIGSSNSVHIGSFAPHNQSSNGTLYHNFLKNIQAFVPSTFDECAEGNQVFTYKNLMRIDFVSVPIEWKAKRCSAGACPIADTMALEEDHIPVYAKCDMLYNVCTTKWTKRKVTLYTLPEEIPRDVAKGFMAEVGSSWWKNSEVNEELNMYHAHIHKCCSLFFPKVKNTFKKNGHISDHTRSIIKKRDRQIVLVRNLKSELGVAIIPRESFAHRAVAKLQSCNKQVRASVIKD